MPQATHKPRYNLAIAFAVSVVLHTILFIDLLENRAGEAHNTSASAWTQNAKLNVEISPRYQPAETINRKDEATPRSTPPEAVRVPPVQSSISDVDDQTIYYPPPQLTLQPQFVSPPLPAFPEREEHFSGTALLAVLLDEEGKVTAVSIVKSDFPKEENSMLIATFKALQFKPGEIDGKAVATRIELEFGFDNGKAKKPNS